MTEPADIAVPRRIVLARIGAPHGIRGEVRVKTFTADPASIADYGPLATPDGRTLEIEALRPVGGSPGMVVVRFRGIADRTAVEPLNGLELTVSRDRLPASEDGEFYHADLVGLTATDPDGAPLGVVTAVHDFGSGDILEIEPPDAPSVMIPFTRAVVPEIDLAARRLMVSPEAWIAATATPPPEDAE